MNETRLLMVASSLFMGLVGLAALILPQELLGSMEAEVATATVTIVQITAALYLGFAEVNWTARGVLIGGVYARPLAMGNLTHFAIGGITFGKLAVATPDPALLALTVPYLVFAAWFGRIVFTPPSAEPSV